MAYPRVKFHACIKKRDTVHRGAHTVSRFWGEDARYRAEAQVLRALGQSAWRRRKAGISK
jgi:hypothetical protein